MRRLLASLLTAALAAALTLVVAPPLAVAGAGDVLDVVAVSGAPGQQPTVTFDLPLEVETSVSQVRTPGSGDESRKGSEVVVDYVILNGRTGEQIEASYGRTPVALVLDKGAQPSLRKGLTGVNAGARVLIAIAPRDGLAAQGASDAVKKGDTLLFVIDVLGVETPLRRATGTPVEPVKGLPTVTLKKKTGKPTITIPKGEAPTTLVVQPLIEGDGKVVEAGQTVRAHYTGMIWDGAKVFDSSWKRKEPAQFPVGTGQLIAGWDRGLVGQTVGSQVLLVVPPAQGYGATGNPQIGIKGDDTLVFVVDILGAT